MKITIESKRVIGVQPKQFREDGTLHHNVRIYLTADDDKSLDKIESVQYTLHPTFRQRIRVSDDRAKQFEIRIWTYGYFPIQAKLLKKDGSVETVDGFVRW